LNSIGLFVGIIAVILIAPFETLSPVVQTAIFKVSNVELIVSLVFAIAAARFLWKGDWEIFRTPLAFPAIALLSIMIISSLATPYDQGEALRQTGRFVAGFGFFLLTIAVVGTSTRRMKVLCVSAAVIGMAVGIVGILEYLYPDRVRLLLAPFQGGPFLVGGLLRVSSTLQYPTITSMYLEIAFGLGLVLFMGSSGFPDLGRVLWFLSLFAIAVAIILTWTRAGIITVGVQLTLVQYLYFRKQGLDGRLLWLSALMAAIGFVLAVFLVSDPTSRLRLITRDHHDWYRAEFVVPDNLSFSPGEIKEVNVQVTNRGRMPWRSDIENPFLLSYHWMEEKSTTIVIFEGLRSFFPHPVQPGESVGIEAVVQAPPQSGNYRLVWDIVQEGRLWFLRQESQLALTKVSVKGEPAGLLPLIDGPRFLPIDEARYQLDRMVLWKAAFSLLKERPLLGVGPGNFRLLYGDVLGLKVWNLNLHANNTYLEFLAGTGIFGGAAFIYLWMCLGALLRRGWKNVKSAHFPFFLGSAAAVVAIAVHGLADHFFSFTPTYLMIWVAFALSVVISTGHVGSSDS